MQNAGIMKCSKCGAVFKPQLRQRKRGRGFCSRKCIDRSGQKKKDPNSRFWHRVDKSGDCWEWMGLKDKDGYGIFHLSLPQNGKREKRAHRASLILSGIPIPAGLCALHKCDNRACVRPDHLYVGTPAQNNSDCIQRGRAKWNYGEECGHSKLTAEDVREIRRRVSDGEVQRRVAEDFKVGYKAINKIVKNQRWTHVK